MDHKQSASEASIQPVMFDDHSHRFSEAEVPIVNQASNNCHPQWWRDNGLRRLNLLIFVIFLSPVIIGYDSSLIGNMLVLPRFYQDVGLDRNNSGLTGIMVAGQSFGAMVVFPFVSWAADLVGRRSVIMIGDLIIVGAVLGQTFCFDAVGGYVLTRFLLGIGSMMSISACPVLVSELAHPRQRAKVASVYGCMIYVGAIAAAWITFGAINASGPWSWRIPTLIQVFPPTLQFFLMFLVPESPRWLVSKGRQAEALAVLATYHANGDATDHLVRLEHHEICMALERDKNEQRQQETANVSQSNPLAGWLPFVQTLGGRRRLVVTMGTTMFVSWGGTNIISYYFSPALRAVGIVAPAQQAGINGGLQILNFCVALCGSMLVDRFGRRPLYLASTLVMLAGMVGTTVASALFSQGVGGSGSSGAAVVFTFFVYQLGVNIGYAPLTAMYVAEVCPYHLRAKAMALHYFAQFTSTAVSQYSSPVALAAIGWRYYLVSVAVLSVAMVVIYFLFPETKGLSMEEIAMVVDSSSGMAETDRGVKGRRRVAEAGTYSPSFDKE